MVRLVEGNRQCAAEINDLKIREADLGLKLEAQGFGVTANRTSPADVRGMMEDLEAEIFQTAAALSDFDFRGHSTAHATGRHGLDPQLHNRMARVLGVELVRLLSAAEAPAIVVQMALQSAISAWGCTKISLWVLERNDHSSNAIWTGLYADIRRSEDPKDSARWRAMTRKQLISRASSSDLEMSLLHRIMDVLVLTKARGADVASRRTVEAEFGNRIRGVVGLVLKLNTDIGTHIVSEDLEAVFIQPGETFVPSDMESMWPAEENELGSISEQSVVCGTGIGLRKRGYEGGRAVIVMKPKVLLHSTVGQLVA
ncbi:hypothetical protein DFH09DRAFT_897511 [Mycena vulgaris]|nr:hypothetical protein DFH09DRAFT_897511 [Mycena vulgaris]